MNAKVQITRKGDTSLIKERPNLYIEKRSLRLQVIRFYEYIQLGEYWEEFKEISDESLKEEIEIVESLPFNFRKKKVGVVVFSFLKKKQNYIIKEVRKLLETIIKTYSCTSIFSLDEKNASRVHDELNKRLKMFNQKTDTEKFLNPTKEPKKIEKSKTISIIEDFLKQVKKEFESSKFWKNNTNELCQLLAEIAAFDLEVEGFCTEIQLELAKKFYKSYELPTIYEKLEKKKEENEEEKEDIKDEKKNKEGEDITQIDALSFRIGLKITQQMFKKYQEEKEKKKIITDEEIGKIFSVTETLKDINRWIFDEIVEKKDLSKLRNTLETYCGAMLLGRISAEDVNKKIEPKNFYIFLGSADILGPKRACSCAHQIFKNIREKNIEGKVDGKTIKVQLVREVKKYKEYSGVIENENEQNIEVNVKIEYFIHFPNKIFNGTILTEKEGYSDYLEKNDFNNDDDTYKIEEIKGVKQNKEYQNVDVEPNAGTEMIIHFLEREIDYNAKKCISFPYYDEEKVNYAFATGFPSLMKPEMFFAFLSYFPFLLRLIQFEYALKRNGMKTIEKIEKNINEEHSIIDCIPYANKEMEDDHNIAKEKFKKQKIQKKNQSNFQERIDFLKNLFKIGESEPVLKEMKIYQNTFKYLFEDNIENRNCLRYAYEQFGELVLGCCKGNSIQFGGLEKISSKEINETRDDINKRKEIFSLTEKKFDLCIPPKQNLKEENRKWKRIEFDEIEKLQKNKLLLNSLENIKDIYKRKLPSLKVMTCSVSNGMSGGRVVPFVKKGRKIYEKFSVGNISGGNLPTISNYYSSWSDKRNKKLYFMTCFTDVVGWLMNSEYSERPDNYLPYLKDYVKEVDILEDRERVVTLYSLRE